MTIIKPNSIAGVTSITAQGDTINFYKSDGTLAGLLLEGVNFNTTVGVSTFNNVTIGGTITYQDVAHVDSVGIITAQQGIQVLANGLDVTGVSTFKSNVSIADYIIHTGDTDTAIRFPAADTFTVETAGSERARINSSGNFGVGTASPTGNVNAGALVLEVNSTGATPPEIKVGGQNAELSIAGGSTASYLWSKGAYPLVIATNGGEKARFDSSGNLGLGTAGPNGLLHVAGGVALVSNVGDTGAIKLAGGGSWNTITSSQGSASSTAKDLAISLGSSEALRIDSSGRLLVGATTSSGESATIQSVGTYPIQMHRGIAGNAGPNIVLSKSRNTTYGSSTIVQDDDTLGTIQFKGDDGTDYRTAGAYIQAFVDGTPGENDMPGRLVFSTTADGASSPTERMRIDSSGRLLVGTTSEMDSESNLVVKSQSYPYFDLARDKGNTTANLSMGAVRFFNNGPGGTFSNIAKLECFSEGTYSSSSKPARLVFSTTASGATSPTERMRISANGDINIDSGAFYFDAVNNRFGVGTASPSYKLHVDGDILIAQSSDLLFGTTSGPAPKITNSGDQNSLSFFTNGSESARIDSSGRLLVGTTSAPAYTTVLLQGNNTDTGGGAVLRMCLGGTDPASTEDLGTITFSDSGQTNAAYIKGRRDSGTWTSGSSQPTYLEFATTADGASSPTERMRIDSSGRVTIAGGNLNLSGSGTQSILVGSTNAGGAQIALDGDANGDGQGGDYAYIIHNTDGDLDLVNLKSGVFTFSGISDSEKVRIDSSGHLIVGGTTAGNAGARTVSIGSPGSINGGLQLWSTTSGASYVQFGDGTGSATDHYRGLVGYEHNNDAMIFHSAAIERLRIDSAGRVITKYAANGEIDTLSDGATITPDFNASNHFTVTLGGNRTLANPSNITAGQSGFIAIVQDGTGSRTLSFGSYWDFASGTAPTLTTTASAVDVLAYYVRSSTSIVADVILNVS